MKLTTISFSTAAGWSAPPDLAKNSKRTLIVVFGASNLVDHPEPLSQLARCYPDSHLIGCSTAGEIFDTKVSDGGLVAALVEFERTEIATAWARVGDASESYTAGQSLARQLLRRDLRGLFVLSDGLNVNGSELARGLNDSLPASVIVTGGLAGDGSRFERTWVMTEGAPGRGTISCVAFYGDAVRIAHGSKGGWDKFGPERLITRSVGNVLFELDGKPALELYKQYLGERASGLPATGLLFPLAVRSSMNEEKVLVRTILGVDEASQSMTFAGDMPEGSLAQLMRANFERLIAGAAAAAAAASGSAASVAGDETGDLLSIAISCVGRRLVLGERTEEELEATMDGLPEGTQQIGFYSYGEISPFTTGRCDLHNQTMTLTAISEDVRLAA